MFELNLGRGGLADKIKAANTSSLGSLDGDRRQDPGGGKSIQHKFTAARRPD